MKSRNILLCSLIIMLLYCPFSSGEYYDETEEGRAPLWVLNIQNKLHKKPVNTYENTDLDTAVAIMAKESGVTIHLMPDAVNDPKTGEKRNFHFNGSLSSLFDIFRMIPIYYPDLGYYYQSKAIYVDLNTNIPRRYDRVSYNISKLIAEFEAKRLPSAGIIYGRELDWINVNEHSEKTNIQEFWKMAIAQDPDSWNDNRASIEYSDGDIVITQTRPVHKKIQKVYDSILANMHKCVLIEGYLLDIPKEKWAGVKQIKHAGGVVEPVDVEDLVKYAYSGRDGSSVYEFGLNAKNYTVAFSSSIIDTGICAYIDSDTPDECFLGESSIGTGLVFALTPFIADDNKSVIARIIFYECNNNQYGEKNKRKITLLDEKGKKLEHNFSHDDFSYYKAIQTVKLNIGSYSAIISRSAMNPEKNIRVILLKAKCDDGPADNGELKESLPEWARNINNKLQLRCPANFKDVPITEFIKFISDISSAPINIQPEAAYLQDNRLQLRTITLNEKSISCQDMLDFITSTYNDIAYKYANDGILLYLKYGTNEKFETVVYNLNDLIYQYKEIDTDPLSEQCEYLTEEEIINNIFNMIYAPENNEKWRPGAGTAIPILGHLVVKQTPEVHCEIRGILEKFKEKKHLLFRYTGYLYEAKQGYIEALIKNKKNGKDGFFDLSPEFFDSLSSKECRLLNHWISYQMPETSANFHDGSIGYKIGGEYYDEDEVDKISTGHNKTIRQLRLYKSHLYYGLQLRTDANFDRERDEIELNIKMTYKTVQDNKKGVRTVILNENKMPGTIKYVANVKLKNGMYSIMKIGQKPEARSGEKGYYSKGIYLLIKADVIKQQNLEN